MTTCFNIPAENGEDILDRLPAVRDCHIDENQTQALSHEREEVGPLHQIVQTMTTWLAFLSKIASKSNTRLAAVIDCHMDENRILALSHERG